MKIHWEKQPMLRGTGHDSGNLRYNDDHRWVGHTDDGTRYSITQGPAGMLASTGPVHYRVRGKTDLGIRPTLAQAKALAKSAEDARDDPNACPTCHGTGRRPSAKARR